MKKVKLGEICDIQAGGTPSRNKKEFWVQGNIPWVKIKDINSKYISKVEEHITELGLQFSSAKLFSRGTILYTIFATIGEVAILDIDAATNQAIAGLHLKSEKVLKDYLYFFLLSIKNRVKNDSRGVAQNNINLTYLKNIEVPIVENSIQQEICNNLTKINQIITLRNQQLIELSNLVKSRFNEMFEEYPDSVFLDTYIKELRAGKSLAGEENNKNKVLKTGAVSYDYFNSSEVKNLPIDYIPLDEHKVEIGDVIISRMNTSELVGAAGYVWTINNDNIYLPDRLWKVVLNDRVNPVFLWKLITNEITKLKIKRIASGTSGSMKNISKSKFLQIRVPFPPLSLQNEFADFVAQVDKSQFACGIVIKLWRNGLKSSII
ncbi:restriction endonuclease subunit S [Streptococcus oralis]|uniref:Restriction endonuclease subunit S n=1 Tax=Streptococcus oralis TaxID=1303 RepID=A0A7T2ZM12_STROR|nr:restriction endonuclease subunit S [Streptococcus oralis]QPS96789.1 restriction endonuclease subunit S [Streptococcus oralis]